MRIEHDEDDEPVYVSDGACSLVDRIAAALASGDVSRARILANNFEADSREAGKEKALQEWRNAAEEENRRAAEFGYGYAVFKTLDKLEAKIKFPSNIPYGTGWPLIWKHALRAPMQGSLLDAAKMPDMLEPIKIRTYEHWIY